MVLNQSETCDGRATLSGVGAIRLTAVPGRQLVSMAGLRATSSSGGSSGAAMAKPAARAALFSASIPMTPKLSAPASVPGSGFGLGLTPSPAREEVLVEGKRIGP